MLPALELMLRVQLQALQPVRVRVLQAPVPPVAYLMRLVFRLALQPVPAKASWLQALELEPGLQLQLQAS